MTSYPPGGLNVTSGVEVVVLDRPSCSGCPSSVAVCKSLFVAQIYLTLTGTALSKSISENLPWNTSKRSTLSMRTHHSLLSHPSCPWLSCNHRSISISLHHIRKWNDHSIPSHSPWLPPHLLHSPHHLPLWPRHPPRHLQRMSINKHPNCRSRREFSSGVHQGRD